MTLKALTRLHDGSVRACKSGINLGAPDSWEIKDVTVDDDRATVTGDATDASIKVQLLEQDGEWKVDDLTRVERYRPTIRRGLNARDTVEAYYRAIEEEDGAALCGLIDQGYAASLAGGDNVRDPLVSCVRALRDYDWSKPQKQAAGVKVVKVTRSGAKARFVRLSHGKRALLTKYDGRWVVKAVRR